MADLLEQIQSELWLTRENMKIKFDIIPLISWWQISITDLQLIHISHIGRLYLGQAVNYDHDGDRNSLYQNQKAQVDYLEFGIMM